MHSLPLFVRLAGRPVILLGEGETADAKRRLLERAGANVVGEDHPASLAIVAIEGETEAHDAVARLQALLPAGIGRLAEALGLARGALRTRFPAPADRRAAIDAALVEGGPLDPLAEHDADAVARWLASADMLAETSLVTIRLASPDPDDLTLRTARLLGRADRVYHRPDVPPVILDRARADAVRIACETVPTDPGPGLSLDLCL